MKLLNKNKIVVSALALAIGASLVGSVSGTIAWYQYSTRANVSFIGKAGGFSGNLQMRFVGEGDNDWRTRITWQEMNQNLADNHFANKIVPITFGGMDKDDAIPNNGGYIQPRLGIAAMSSWYSAAPANYAQFQLELRYNARDGIKEGDPEVDDKNVAKDVYLSKLLIQQDQGDAASKGDLSNAIRVHIKSSNGSSKLISKLGKDVATSSRLDIDGDGKLDQAYPEGDEFGFGYTNSERNTLSYVRYGDNGVQTSYAAVSDPVDGSKWTQGELDAVVAAAYDKTVEDVKTPGVHFTQDEINNAQEGDDAYGKTVDDWKVEPVYFTQAEIDLAEEAHNKTTADWRVNPTYPALVYSENNRLYDKTDKLTQPDPSKSIGTTLAGDAAYLTVTVTIWVEGWQSLDGSAIWDTKYIDSSFNVGIQFAVQDELA